MVEGNEKKREKLINELRRILDNSKRIIYQVTLFESSDKKCKTITHFVAVDKGKIVNIDYYICKIVPFTWFDTKRRGVRGYNVVGKDFADLVIFDLNLILYDGNKAITRKWLI